MPPFSLPDTVSGRTVSSAELAGQPAVVVFICNHCPYVQHLRAGLAVLGRFCGARGVGMVAISSNDVATYPADSPELMKSEAASAGYSFPYLYDESQQVARAYGAVCTPDFFGFDAGRLLQYRGRLDAGRNGPPPPGAKRELVEAMRAIAAGREPAEQTPSIGCSIKWKAA